MNQDSNQQTVGVSNAISRYKSQGFGDIDGWCSEALFPIVELIDKTQKSLGVRGGVCEIGVHHGKFFLLLNAVTSADEASWAIDIFGNQALNVDKSGHGSLEAFRDNLNKYDVHRGGNVNILEADSTAAETADLLHRKIQPGAIRIFSIDGGHTVSHTVSDLHLANSLICNQGVVIVDDILNHHWLGVIQGVLKFLDAGTTLVPFAIGHNKLLMSKLSFQNVYLQVFAKSGMGTKLVNLAGHQLVAL